MVSNMEDHHAEHVQTSSSHARDVRTRRKQPKSHATPVPDHADADNHRNHTVLYQSSPSLPLVFSVLVVIRILAALYSPITDCDETFNYWEPMHFLLYRFGFQTWEYSPQFALRSYAYLYPYAAVAKLATLLHRLLFRFFNLPVIPSPKIFAFYALRVFLGISCSVAETFLYRVIRRRYQKSISLLFFAFLSSSPGMFRSSVEFLPSSFAMLFLVFAFAAWIENNLFLAVFCVAVSSLLGWIFSAILAVPLALDIISRTNGVWTFSKHATISGVTVIAFMTIIDSYYFGRIVIAPLNHIVYNVFPKDGAGSQLYGEEPWTFYARNLILNCNMAAVIFVVYPLLVSVGRLARVPDHTNHALRERLRFLSAPYLAIAVFISQPHKEERFLVPCYPLIALVAAFGIVDGFTLVRFALTSSSSRNAPKISSKAGSTFFTLLSTLVIMICAILGASRTLMQVKSYGAPIRVHRILDIHELMVGLGPRRSPREYTSENKEVNICIGSEWYRFPTNFFIPDKRFRVRFIRSGFDGLLPQPFQESANGTTIVPQGMNEFNIAHADQFYDWMSHEGCHYFINLDLSHRRKDASQDHASYPIPLGQNHIVHRERLLDSEMTRSLYRAFYVPGWQHRIINADFQLVRNTKLLPYNDES